MKSGNHFVLGTDVAGTGKTFTYDANGNLTSDGTRTFEWDARNKPVVMSSGTTELQFYTDGALRTVRTVMTVNSSTQSDAVAVWCDTRPCEQREYSSGTVLSRSFGQGTTFPSTSEMLVRDHLGSAVALSTNGTVTARTSYDLWGRPDPTSASALDGYTTHAWNNSVSSWHTMYRVYDPGLGRWLSEDPANLDGDGPNLYAYVRGNPIRLVDQFGLASSAMSAIQSLFHSCDFSYYRNRFNRCPAKEPKNNPEWTQDSWLLSKGLMLIGGSGVQKYRNRYGQECAYDECGDLTYEGTYNYEPNPRTWRHIRLDVIPSLFCATDTTLTTVMR